MKKLIFISIILLVSIILSLILVKNNIIKNNKDIINHVFIFKNIVNEEKLKNDFVYLKKEKNFFFNAKITIQEENIFLGKSKKNSEEFFIKRDSNKYFMKPNELQGQFYGNYVFSNNIEEIKNDNTKKITTYKKNLSTSTKEIVFYKDSLLLNSMICLTMDTTCSDTIERNTFFYDSTNHLIKECFLTKISYFESPTSSTIQNSFDSIQFIYFYNENNMIKRIQYFGFDKSEFNKDGIENKIYKKTDIFFKDYVYDDSLYKANIYIYNFNVGSITIKNGSNNEYELILGKERYYLKKNFLDKRLTNQIYCYENDAFKEQKETKISYIENRIESFYHRNVLYAKTNSNKFLNNNFTKEEFFDVKYDTLRRPSIINYRQIKNNHSKEKTFKYEYQ